MYQSIYQRQETNLGYLLIDMLEFYGKRFNYANVSISVKDHCYYPKYSYDQGKIMLSLEDPNDTGNDVGRSAFRVSSWRAAFKDASDKLGNNVKSNYAPTLLSRIIHISGDELSRREKLEQAALASEQQPELNYNDLIDEAIRFSNAQLASSGLATITQKPPSNKPLLFDITTLGEVETGKPKSPTSLDAPSRSPPKQVVNSNWDKFVKENQMNGSSSHKSSPKSDSWNHNNELGGRFGKEKEKANKNKNKKRKRED